MSAQWVPDELANACRGCQGKFTLFFRRHHCRFCGHVFCNDCSAGRASLRPGEEPVRVCNGCVNTLKARVENARDDKLAVGSSVIYETRSLCLQCAFSDSHNFKFAHNVSFVVQVLNNVYLYSQCGHADHIRTPAITRLCTDARFFHRMLRFCWSSGYGEAMVDQFLLVAASGPVINNIANADAAAAKSPLMIRYAPPQGHTANYAPPPPPPGAGQPPLLTLDSKEIYRRLVAPSRYTESLPLAAELDLYRDDAIASVEEIKEDLLRLSNLYPPGVTFMLKLNVGLVVPEDIALINERILLIDLLMNGAAVEAGSRAAAEAAAAANAAAAAAAVAAANAAVAAAAANTASGPGTPGSARADDELLRPDDTDSAARCFILVDASFERVIDMCRLDESAFIRGRVFPLIRYFLVPGEEQQCCDEIALAVATLQSFVDIQLALYVAVDPEALPDLTKVCALALSLTHTIRFVLFTHRRAFRPLMERTSLRARALGRRSHLELQLQQQQQQQQQQSQQQSDEIRALTAALGGLSVAEAVRATPQSALVAVEQHVRLTSRAALANNARTPATVAAVAASAASPSSASTGSGFFSNAQNTAAAAAAAECWRAESVDPMPLLQLLHAATGGLLSPSGFVPLAAAHVLEPVLCALGLGRLPLNPDPFSAFASIVVHRGALGAKAAAKAAVSLGQGAAATTALVLSPGLGEHLGLTVSGSAAGGGSGAGGAGAAGGAGSRRGSGVGAAASSGIGSLPPPSPARPLDAAGAAAATAAGDLSPAQGFVSLYNGKVVAANLASQFDLKKVFEEARNVIKAMDPGARMGLVTATKLKAVLARNSVQGPRAPFASIDDLVSATASSEEQKRRFRHTQVFIVLNEQDFGSVDLVRRVRPLIVRRNPDASSQQDFVSASIGCI